MKIIDSIKTALKITLSNLSKNKNKNNLYLIQYVT